MNLEILATPLDVAKAAAQIFAEKSSEAVAARGYFTVALSGGSTPKLLYQVLADRDKEHVPWMNVQFFWSDERHVPPDHPESNYRMANDAMLSHVPVSSENVHRVTSENPDAAHAAKEYEEEILKFVAGSRFDLILLGLGNDGHTASIFPDSEVLHETKRLVVAPFVEKLNTYRITMTLPLINHARTVMFLVTGAEKAEIVTEVLKGTGRYPAQEVRPINGELIWLLDREAACKFLQD